MDANETIAFTAVRTEKATPAHVILLWSLLSVIGVLLIVLGLAVAVWHG